MHKSRLGGFIIDCNSDDLDAAPSAAPGGAEGRSPERVHLDIEADDIEAEVRPARELGAGASARLQPG